MNRATGKTMINKRQRGFSLVEILVSITLSLVVLAGVLAVMYSSKVTYMENDRVARIQEAGRAALDLMLRDLRGGGYSGCAHKIADLVWLNNQLNDSAEIPWNFAEPVYGFEGSGGSWTPALDTALTPDATEDSDVLLVRTIPAGAPVMQTTVQTDTTDDIEVEKAAGDMLAVGTPAVISDCYSLSAFVVTNFDGAAADTTAKISHASGGGTPSNSTDELGAMFRPGARVAPITSIAYYVAPSTTGSGTSLWRVVSNNAPEELVPGVQAMQLKYGVDTDEDPMITGNEYVDADAVTDWSHVVAVSISLLVRSAEENSKEVDTRTWQMLDTPVGPFNDHFQRALFTTTVTFRNGTK
jgi:type IV pilus assembly protein PilW